VLCRDSEKVGGADGTEGWKVTDPQTGEPVLWTRGWHFNGGAGGRILLPRKRYLIFPVTGTNFRNAVMTAVTESGGTPPWFRRSARAADEILVSPDYDLTAELMCIAALAAGWFRSYFASPH